MAQEATVSVSLRFKKGAIDVVLAKSGLLVDVSGDDFIRNQQVVGITEEALLIGDVTPGLCLMINRDEDNFVSVQAASGATACIKILPGEAQLFRFSGPTPYVVADTAPVRIEYLLLDV